MSNITLQGQIEYFEAGMTSANVYEEEILASLKRLQAAEGQEAVAKVSRVENDDLAFEQITDFHVINGMKLYALPPDAQGMIDQLTANNESLWSTLIALGDKLGIDHEKARKEDGKPSDVFFKHVAAIEAERDELKQWKEAHSTKMGVGDGSGELYVYSDYDSIKAAQSIVFERDALRKQLAQGEAVAPELMAIYDVYNFPNSWLMSVAAPIGTECETVWNSLEKQKYKIDNVILRHTITSDKSLVSQLLTDYGYAAPPAKPVIEREATLRDVTYDRAYRSGMQRGWNLGITENTSMFESEIASLCQSVKDGRAALNQPAELAVSSCAEDYLRNKYGAYRGSLSWRKEAEAFEAGQASAKHIGNTTAKW